MEFSPLNLSLNYLLIRKKIFMQICNCTARNSAARKGCLAERQVEDDEGCQLI